MTACVAERAAAREYAGVRREIALAGQVVVLEARVATAEAHAAMVERSSCGSCGRSARGWGKFGHFPLKRIREGLFIRPIAPVITQILF